MKVRREPLDGTPMQRLVVTDPQGSDAHAGECVGYLCPHCLAADETLQQVYHEADCDLAGEHGRQHYDSLEPDAPTAPSPEFDPRHPITVVKAGETEGRGGLCEGEVLAFRCRCGNADEDLFELIHDEDCPLADRDLSAAGPGATAAD